MKNIERYAIFLDLDGTLADLAERPDDVRLEVSVIPMLRSLRERACHAVAVITGRDILFIDKILHPLVLPVGGVHGLQRRDAAGVMRAEKPHDLSPLALVLENTFAAETGVMVERKAGAVAIHFRLRPDMERRCREVLADVVRRRPELRLLEGKKVLELVPRGANKGSVIDAFLAESPFAGRTPIFAGDDVTDEAGFVAVNARHGVSIKIGGGATAARYRAPGASDFRCWLGEMASPGERVLAAPAR